MPDLCDVNYLLPLCHGQYAHHPVAKRFLDSVTAPASLVVCRISQLGLLRLLSNPVVMQDTVCSTDKAWRVYDTLMLDERFVFFDEPSRLNVRLKILTQGFPFSPKLWQDAYLAAFAIEAKLRMLTFDQGFKKFADIDCALLLRQGNRP